MAGEPFLKCMADMYVIRCGSGYRVPAMGSMDREGGSAQGAVSERALSPLVRLGAADL